MTVFAYGVVINKVMFNPGGTDTGLEWIELFNGNQTDTNLSGWQLYADAAGYFSFPSSFVLGPSKHVVVHIRQSGTDSSTDLYYPVGSSSNMGNTSGSATLFNAEPRGKDTIKSFVEWGKSAETWESAAADAGMWGKGTFIDLSSFVEGQLIALHTDGVATGQVSAWGITSPGQSLPSPTPSPSGLIGSPSPSPSDSPSSPAQSLSPSPRSSPPSPTPSVPHISAYAGEERTVWMSTAIEFVGYAKGLAGSPLETARFWWNFGDGQTQEGRSVLHEYAIPGLYTAGLHISSGEYTASDYVAIHVVPNQAAISGVLIGKEGFFRLENKGNDRVDIGGWSIEDSKGRRFIFPPKTIVAPHAQIAFANRATGLLGEDGSLPLTVRYQSGTTAFVYAGGENVPAPTPSPWPSSRPETLSTPKDHSPLPTARPSTDIKAQMLETPAASSSVHASAVGLASPSVSHNGRMFTWFALGLGVLGVLGSLTAKRFFL